MWKILRGQKAPWRGVNGGRCMAGKLVIVTRSAHLAAQTESAVATAVTRNSWICIRSLCFFFWFMTQSNPNTETWYPYLSIQWYLHFIISVYCQYTCLKIIMCGSFKVTIIRVWPERGPGVRFWKPLHCNIQNKRYNEELNDTTHTHLLWYLYIQFSILFFVCVCFLLNDKTKLTCIHGLTSQT